MNTTLRHLLITTALSSALFASRAIADETNYSPVLEVSNISSKKRTVGEINYMQPIWNNENNLVLADVKLKADTNKGKEANVGLVYRHNLNDAVVLGVYNYFDHRKTGNNFSVSGYTGGVEALSKYVDARVNIYLPQNKKKKIVHNNDKSINFVGTSVFAKSGGHTYEQSYKGFDVEVGTPIFAFNDDLNEKIGTKIFVAKYDFTSKGAKKISGLRFRMEQPLGTLELGNAGLHFMLNAETQYDNVRKRQYAAGISARFVFDEETKAGRRGKKTGLSSRMMDKVIRDVDIVTGRNKESETFSNLSDSNGNLLKKIYYVSGTKTTDGDGTPANPFSKDQLNQINLEQAHAKFIALEPTGDLLSKPGALNGISLSLHEGNTQVFLDVTLDGKATITHSEKNTRVHAPNAPHLTVNHVEDIQQFAQEQAKSFNEAKAKTEKELKKNELQSATSLYSSSITQPIEELPPLEPQDYIEHKDLVAKFNMLQQLKEEVEIVEPNEEGAPTIPVLRDANEEAAQAAALEDFARVIREGVLYVAGQVKSAISAVDSNINSGLENIAEATDQNHFLPEAAPAPVSAAPTVQPAAEDYSEYFAPSGYLHYEEAASRTSEKGKSMVGTFLSYFARPAPKTAVEVEDIDVSWGIGAMPEVATDTQVQTLQIDTSNVAPAPVAPAPVSVQDPLSNIREGLTDSDRLFAAAVARRQARLDAERVLEEKNQAATQIQAAFRSFQARKEIAQTPLSEVRETVLGPQSEQVDATLYRAAHALGQGLNQVAQSASQRFNQFFGAIGSYFASPVSNVSLSIGAMPEVGTDTQGQDLHIDKSYVAPAPVAPASVVSVAQVEAAAVSSAAPAVTASEPARLHQAATQIQAAFKGSSVRKVVNKAKEIAVNIKLLDSLTKDAEALKEVAKGIAEDQKLKGDDPTNATNVRKHLEAISKKTAVKKKEFKAELKEQYAQINPKLSLMGVSEKRLGEVVAESKLFKDQRSSYLKAMQEVGEVRVQENLEIYRTSGAIKDILELRVEQARVALFKSLNSKRDIKRAQERLVLAIINTLPENPTSPASKAFFKAANPLEAVLSTRKTRPEAGGVAAGSIATPRKLFGGAAGAAGTPGTAE